MEDVVQFDRLFISSDICLEEKSFSIFLTILLVCRDLLVIELDFHIITIITTFISPAALRNICN